MVVISSRYGLTFDERLLYSQKEVDMWTNTLNKLIDNEEINNNKYYIGRVMKPICHKCTSQDYIEIHRYYDDVICKWKTVYCVSAPSFIYCNHQWISPPSNP